MPVSKKSADENVEVRFYDAADSSAHESVAVARKYSAKETVNLCMKDKKDISAGLFFLLLAIVLLVLVLIEFFFAYLPYRRLEQAEADLQADRAQFQQLQISDEEFARVEQDYLKYNYENFDKSITDREDILDLLEATVFKYGKVTSLRISGNTIEMNLSGVASDKVETLQADLRGDKHVNNVLLRSEKIENGLADVTMSILLNDATTVKED